jgi:hypothetical protein
VKDSHALALFVYYMDELGFSKLQFIRKEFPDACASDKHGNEKYIEFELDSSGYETRLRNPEHNNVRCDYVICWKHDCARAKRFLSLVVLVLAYVIHLCNFLAWNDQCKWLICILVSS